MKPDIELKSSKIYIKNGIISEAGMLIKSEYPDAKVLIVSDYTVAGLYLEALKESLDVSSVPYDTMLFNDGEKTKTLSNIEALCEKAADNEMNRGDVILALGGGVIGDLAGFAAAVFLRGIKFIALPTTLLAQVDSSVGGKTGVNLKQGKNLVGSFYKADHVLIDPETLKTLNDREFQCGMAEVIKYGCIWDDELFARLESLKTRAVVMSQIKSIVKTCCEIKAEIVCQDEYDRSLRMILNFGHTIGHAIENTIGYGEISHGQAVAIGMVKITKGAEKKGLTEVGTAERIEQLLKQFGLATEMEGYDRAKIMRAIVIDKKNIGKHMNLILLKHIGQAEIIIMSSREMEAYL